MGGIEIAYTDPQGNTEYIMLHDEIIARCFCQVKEKRGYFIKCRHDGKWHSWREVLGDHSPAL